jgi:ankyrin repeat protein
MSVFDYVWRHDTQALKELIARGADVNVVDEQGCTALWWAVRGKRDAFATALVDAKADVNKASNSGYTPLHQASINGHVGCMRLLIKHKANVNALNFTGESPMHAASLNMHLTCVQILVAAGAEVDRPDNYERTPLWVTIGLNHSKISEVLLNSGAKMKNVRSKSIIPPGMTDIIAKRCTIMSCTLALKGVLKWRLGIYKDVTHLIALYFWRIRLNYFTSSNTL